jgi:hypothetical protein
VRKNDDGSYSKDEENVILKFKQYHAELGNIINWKHIERFIERSHNELSHKHSQLRNRETDKKNKQEKQEQQRKKYQQKKLEEQQKTE